MQNVVKRFGFAIAVTALLGATPAFAQQAPPREPAPPQEPRDPAPVSGALVGVNTDAKTLMVKTAAGADLTFSYTDQTEVMGADKGISGLAPSSETEVTVHYKVHGTANVATKIEVRTKA